MDIERASLLSAAGFGGGVAAAIAGGASLITFPTLLGLGLAPVAANATNSVGLSLSNFMAAVADWRRRPSWGRSLSWLFAINVVGGAIGAFLMLTRAVGSCVDRIAICSPCLSGMVAPATDIDAVIGPPASDFRRVTPCVHFRPPRPSESPPGCTPAAVNCLDR